MADYTDDRRPTNDRVGDTNYPRVARLSDLGDFEVAEGYPDVRGWDVLAADGTRVGEVKDLVVDTGAMRTRYLDIELNKELRSARAGDEGHVLVPIGSARLQDDDDRVLLSGVSIDQVAALPAYDDRLLQGDASRFAQDDFDDRRFYGRRGRADARAGTAGAEEARVTRAEE